MDLVFDTLDSIFHHMTEDVLVLIDGACQEMQEIDFPVYKLIGFKHGIPKSPYRNVALALQSIHDIYPEHDWYCYMEYDCLVTSKRFKYNLEMADDQGIWMLGTNGRVDEKRIPLVESLIGGEFRSPYYLLGSCQFFSKHFILALKKIDFFNRFLSITNVCRNGEMPGYSGYDVSEHLYPSLCRQFGGGIGVFSTWDSINNEWHGSSDVFPIRWKPEIEPEMDNKNMSICHPIKDFNHPIRQFHREVRKCTKTQKV